MKVKSLIALFSLSLVTSFAFASDPKTQQEGIALIQQAIDKTNIFELPAFTLKAKVTVNSKGKDVEGTYQLFWNGPDQWREQIQFPDYGEIRVGGKGVVFTKRSLDFISVEVQAVRSTLGFGSSPLLDNSSFLWASPHKDEKIKKIQEKKQNGTKAKCVEMVGRKSHNREVCIAESNGALIRDGYKDADFANVAEKLFPRSLLRVVKGEPEASVSIIEIKLGGSFPDKVFDPPPASSSEPGCMNPEPPLVTTTVAPLFPSQERSSNLQGMVSVDAMIGIDEAPRNLKLVEGPSAGLNQAAIDAIRQWRFQPAKCGDRQVDSELLLSIIFVISQ